MKWCLSILNIRNDITYDNNVHVDFTSQLIYLHTLDFACMSAPRDSNSCKQALLLFPAA